MFTRKSLVAALMAAACTVAISAQPTVQPAAQRTLVRAGHLLDVKTGRLLDGQTIVVVEQNISAALSLASRVYVLNNGHIIEEMTTQTIKAQPELLHRHLGV